MPDQTPAVSVQVPVRNPGAAFAAFLGSLSVQGAGGTEYELIVVDDGSDEPVGERFDLRPEGCTRMELVRLQGRGNRPRARNAALEASKAPVSFFTDADLRLAPGVLAGHAAFHGSRGGRAVLRGLRINAWSVSATRWQKWFDTRAGGAGGTLSAMPWRHFVTGNASVPRDLAVEAGLFDEMITGYGGEDTEFAYRLHLAGASFFRDPSLRADHLDDVSVRRHSAKMEEYGSTGLAYTLSKHPGLVGLLGTAWVPEHARGPAGRLRAALVKAAVSDPVYRSILRLMELVGRPGLLFTYLSVGACLRGYTRRSHDGT
ncbi:MAG: glycosyltransferase [Candidatus Fermentibacter sp.]|nr:glycosyltransferase [Candidatus Fermentibacter sp.]